MLALVVPISARRQGTYVLLEALLPARPPQNIGVFLMDPNTNRAWIRMRGRYDNLADPDDAEVLEALWEDLETRCAESGAEACLESLEDSLSNTLRISDRQAIAVDAI